MTKIRPHHLLDIIRDFGNDRKRDPHPWGASLGSVTNDILSHPDTEVELVLGVDSICTTCLMLSGGICQAKINNELLMREYNDALDAKLFAALNIQPNTKMTPVAFLKLVKNNMHVLKFFASPNENAERRLAGTVSAFSKLGI